MVGGEGHKTGHGDPVEAYARLEEWARERGFDLRGARVLLQGFGNVGSSAAEILAP